MTAWVIKCRTDDLKRALAIVEEQRNRGDNVWIEDEDGGYVDEQSLKKNDVKSTKPALYEKGKGVLILLAAAVAAIGTLYALGLWVDH
jgi:hypothetical protein